jgi:hypothetical protein
MLAEGVNGGTPHFHVFTGGVVSTDERLYFVAHRLFDRSLASYGGTTRGFRPTPRSECVPTMTRCDATQLRRAFPFG